MRENPTDDGQDAPVRGVPRPVVIDEEQVLQQQLARRKVKWDGERRRVFRLYNVFRVAASLLLLALFYLVDNVSFVGGFSPTWFQVGLWLYVMFNFVSGYLGYVDDARYLGHKSSLATFVILDLFFLSALLFASGGAESGLGPLMVFSIAFGSVLVVGQTSFLFPALATVNGLSGEIYFRNIGAADGSQHFFSMALLGTAFFSVNLFFQFISRRLEERELEVVNLETLDQLHQIAERSRRELEISNARFTVLLGSTGEGVLGLDMNGVITFANPRACSLLAIDYFELIDSDIQRFMLQADTDNALTVLRPQKILELLDITAAKTYDAECWQTGTGERFVVDYSCETTVNKDGEPTGAVLLFRNITQEKANEDRLRYLTNFDELTGLSNRASFQSAVKNAITRAQFRDRTLGILVVDHDHFAAINEDLGQAVGDQVLKTAAERILYAVRTSDQVARLHGDQYAILLADLDSPQDAGRVAEKIIAEIGKPMDMGDREVSTSVSVGIAVLSNDQQDDNELLAAAMSALDAAKADGRNTYQFYNSKNQQKADERRRIQIMLRSAVDNGEFFMVYQPIVAISDGRIESCEALIRWTPPDSPLIRPDTFIPIAEESGQINYIGAWVLNSVARQIAEWKQELGYFPSVALNISSKQLRDSSFRQQYQDILDLHQIPVNVLELELTETGVMEDPETCLTELLELRALGVKLSIDDFGMGYSSLDYLRRLPMDILKVDQSFTRGIGDSENDEEIVRVMIGMAHSMGLKVICEGVETPEQLAFLRENDCDLGQGYYFSKPKTVAELTQMLKAERQDAETALSS